MLVTVSRTENAVPRLWRTVVGGPLGSRRGVHTGANWRIRLNESFAVAVSVATDYSFSAVLCGVRCTLAPPGEYDERFVGSGGGGGGDR